MYFFLSPPPPPALSVYTRSVGVSDLRACVRREGQEERQNCRDLCPAAFFSSFLHGDATMVDVALDFDYGVGVDVDVGVGVVVCRYSLGAAGVGGGT